MKIIIISLFFFFNLNADYNTTCIEKSSQLNKLKLQKDSLVENVAAYMFSWNAINYSKDEDKKILAQKIRILKMELKLCMRENKN